MNGHRNISGFRFSFRNPTRLAAGFDFWSSRWHDTIEPVVPPAETITRFAVRLHAENFRIWHLEDRVRRTDLSATERVDLKTAIDRRNQARCEWIENIDCSILEKLSAMRVTPPADAAWHTESPGQVLDRLSVLSLRLYHLKAEVLREDAPAAHRQACAEKLEEALDLRNAVLRGAETYFRELSEGRRTFPVARSLKMYNDPATNPELRNGG